jgi:hypothetical protein
MSVRFSQYIVRISCQLKTVHLCILNTGVLTEQLYLELIGTIVTHNI